MWVFLNRALGLRDIGCRVIRLDSVIAGTPIPKVEADSVESRRRLERFGLDADVAVVYQDGSTPPVTSGAYLDLDAASQADSFLNLGYVLAPTVVKRFRRSEFIDIDPGLTQTWNSLGQLEMVKHDAYFTYGETVGQPGSKIPDCGKHWLYTAPPMFLPAWSRTVNRSVSYTTVTNWWGDPDWIEIEGECVDNSKRAAFLEYLELPKLTSCSLEWALPLTKSDDVTRDLGLLSEDGWSVRDVLDVSATPENFRASVQASRGEFRCMKKDCSRLDTAWIGETVLSYLASGKPAVIQYTGKSRFLPGGAGLFRFRNVSEAARTLSMVERDYEKHSQAARALPEQYFDSSVIATSVLEHALA
jgi:hypothetical protein